MLHSVKYEYSFLTSFLDIFGSVDNTNDNLTNRISIICSLLFTMKCNEY